jgi:heat shock protein HtpX
VGPPASATPPPRRSLAGWAVLAVTLIVCSYVLTLLLAAACVYIPLLLIRTLIFTPSAIFLLVGGAAVAGTMLWSLAPRRDRFQPPGPQLDPNRQPRLFSELESIAKALHEPMPDAVYLIPDVNASVVEHGGAMGFGGRRVMSLGLPLMRSLTVSQFRAVLAHEFGHFYGGDTRLGPWVFRTRQTMFRTLASLNSDSGMMKVLRLNALAVFIRNGVLAALEWYWKLFLRVTLAASRRLEFRADELACWLAGSQALIDGLCSIAKASAAGQPFWQTELGPALQAGYRPPLAEGFGLFLASRGIHQATTMFLAKELQKTAPQPYDTHPPLSARITAAHSLPYKCPPAEDVGAISLIDDLDNLELQLLQARIPQLKNAALKPMPWDRVGVEVYIPGWRRYVAEYTPLLTGLTAESLPEAVKNLSQMGSRMRDPKGMLLTRDQRAGRAAGLLWISLAVALIDRGWALHAQPGESFLEHPGLPPLKPVEIVAQLKAGKLTAGDWLAQCQAAAITGLPLMPPPAECDKLSRTENP